MVEGSALKGSDVEGKLWEVEENGRSAFPGDSGGTGPQTSQDGGEEALVVPSIVPGLNGAGSASRCSVNVTWKELNMRDETGSQSR